MTLSAMDLKTLKTADQIVFVTKKDAAYIRCIKNATKQDAWDTAQQTRCIPVESFGATEASYMYHSPQYTDTWQTVLCHLKADDILTLRWEKDYHTNGYMESARCDGTRKDKYGEEEIAYAGLHGDALRLQVDRKDKRFVYHLGASLCPDNSARMIKRA